MLAQAALFVVIYMRIVHCQSNATEAYTHMATLADGNLVVYWNFNQINITFEVQAKTTGWVGIGFSSSASMVGADIVVGWIKDGEATITDRHGTSQNEFPPIDTEQNIFDTEGKENDGWTMIKFSRALDSCVKDDRDITKSTKHLIWAYGDEDPAGDDITPENWHGTSQRGSKSMYFLDPPEMRRNELPVGPEYKTFDIVADRVHLPAQEEYYTCRILKIPEVRGKKHVVKFEPVIQDGNAPYVHHMLVYRCANRMENPSELGVNFNCHYGVKHSLTCNGVIASWIIGGGETVFPDEAGFSVGAPGDVVYVKLEMHYVNPEKKSGIVDSSAIRMTYTNTLRQHDAGIFEAGIMVSGIQHFIPPGAKNFKSVGFCAGDCLENAMDSAGVTNITVFNVVLHSHLSGRSLKLRHFRNGTELPYIAYDDSYDADYQHERYLNPTIQLMPNDILRMECVYNTEGRTKVTEAGETTKHEMCLAVIAYYPRIDVGFCETAAEVEPLWKYFGIWDDNFKVRPGKYSLHDYKVTVDGNSAVKTAMEAISEYEWTDENIAQFSKDYIDMKQQSLCSSTEGFKFNTMSSPIFDSEYTPEQTCTPSFGSGLSSGISPILLIILAFLANHIGP